MLQGNIHLHIEPVLRSSGQSIIMRVAYQTTGAMRNPRTGQWHNFRYKSSEIGGTLLITPHAETSNREAIAAFWGQVEQHHKRKDAVPGRTASVALPCELSREENLRLMYDYGRWLSKTYGIGVQVTAHQLDGGNPHFHLTITSCAVLPDGSFGKKVMRLDPIAMQRNKEESPAETLWARWADMVNKAYVESVVAEHVDHRSYARRGISKIPTVHEGVWHHAPSPVNSPVTQNATIKAYNFAVQEEKDLAKQREDIENKLTALQHDDSVSKVTASEHAPEPTPKSDTLKQSSSNSAKGAVPAHSVRYLDDPKPVEQKRAVNGVAGHAVGNDKRTLPETADKGTATVALQPARKPVKQTVTPKEVKPVSALEKVSFNSAKGNLAVENTAAAQPSSPQNDPTLQAQQASWHSRAWDMIVDFARTMPRTNRENELRGACLQFCKKYPKITADYIEKVLSLHSKRTPEEQKRVVASVAEYIAGRGKQHLSERIQEKSGEGRTPEAVNSSSQSQVAAMSKPEVATPQLTSTIEQPQPKPLVVQPIAEMEVVPPSTGTSQVKAVDEHNVPKAPSSTTSRNEIDTGDSIGRDIRSALQSYCTMLAEKAEAAEAYGQVKRRDLIRALLHAPVGDQIAGLRKWLNREHPNVAQEIGKRLSFALKTSENTKRLHRLENVLRYLPPDFVRNRLGIEMQEGSNDAVAGVAAAKNCTRFEAVKMIASVMPAIMRLGQDARSKDAGYSYPENASCYAATGGRTTCHPARMII